MSQVLVTEQYLEDIADSIRAKNGSANTYTPAQMANAIDSFYPEPSGSVSITDNGTYNIKDKEYVNVNVNSGSVESSNDILYHFDGDLKNYGKADAAFYNVTGFSISNEQSKFGNYSLKCGTTQTIENIYLRNGFSFGADDFTIDFWAYGLALSTDASIPISFTFRSISFYLYSNKISFGVASPNGGSWASIKEEPVSIPNNQWNHVALTRNNGYLRLFLNGVKLTTMEYQIGSNAIAPTKTITVGSNSYSSGYSRFRGYISEFRIKLGEAVWIDDFTPPTQPYT